MTEFQLHSGCYHFNGFLYLDVTSMIGLSFISINCHVSEVSGFQCWLQLYHPHQCLARLLLNDKEGFGVAKRNQTRQCDCSSAGLVFGVWWNSSWAGPIPILKSRHSHRSGVPGMGPPTSLGDPWHGLSRRLWWYLSDPNLDDIAKVSTAASNMDQDWPSLWLKSLLSQNNKMSLLYHDTGTFMFIFYIYDFFCSSEVFVAAVPEWPSQRSRGSLLMIQLAQLHRHPGIYERPTECRSFKKIHIFGKVCCLPMWVGYGWIFDMFKIWYIYIYTH